ncbi:MAG: hypothetical protein LBJ58_04865 [Tannerellaceae bacterium]|jgi:hypothetical protein|nr:hypothetical protein [Tannerellaceae bacterium]
MKRRLITVFAGLVALGLPFCAEAQISVGINMENPQGMFHLDGRSSTATTNPDTGMPTSAQQADDVLITNTGYTGIGTASPSTRLEINLQGQTATPALRIMDGSQGAGKILTSDAQGVAQWQTWTPPTTVRDTVFPIITLSAQNFNIGAYTQVNSSVFVVPATGFYAVELRWWGDFNVTSTTPVMGVFVFQFRRNGAVIDEFIWHEYNMLRVTAFTTLYAKASQGDVLSVWVNPTDGLGSYFSVGHVSGMNWVLSRILYKRLGLEDDANYFN